MPYFENLKLGDHGPLIELVQLALIRAGYDIKLSGTYDDITAATVAQFKYKAGIELGTPMVGDADDAAWRAMMPFLMGFRQIQAGENDSLFSLADLFGVNPKALRTANPDLKDDVPAGRTVTVPLGFEVVPRDISFTSDVLDICIKGLVARYPFIETETIGTSVMGSPIHLLKIGKGPRKVLYNAAHHANEWITSPLLMLFLEKYAAAIAFGGKIFDIDAQKLYSNSTLYAVPMVNPDGVDLVTERLKDGPFYQWAKALSGTNPAVSFPSGWKANLRGVDLNLQYPAGWEKAAAAKAAQGIVAAGPRDYAGPAPLSEPESRALFRLTRTEDFQLTLSYHTQGRVIYWKYLDFEPKNSLALATKFAAVSGYDAEETPIASGYAGYKDWFIASYDRPGYTIEAGDGVSPLPLSQLSRIFEDNLGILTLGLSPEGAI